MRGSGAALSESGAGAPHLRLLAQTLPSPTRGEDLGLRYLLIDSAEDGVPTIV